ncbi:MAG: hypothetical protein HW395_51 [candidate division NC10 bacterium]|nr:hypothetical protein [candidate division NC10 bacterium]
MKKVTKPRQAALHAWVVEGSWKTDGGRGPWHPVGGIGLDRIQGRAVLREWQCKNPSDRFRLRKYFGTRP